MLIREGEVREAPATLCVLLQVVDEEATEARSPR